MTAKKFIIELRESIIEENLIFYKDTLINTNLDDVSDNYWREFILFFRKLPKKDKEILLKILRQVEVDTISSILSLLDGNFWLPSQDEEFRLTVKGQDEILNIELQDIFFDLEENEPPST